MLTTSPARPDEDPPFELSGFLEQAVAEGLINAEQAAALNGFATARAPNSEPSGLVAGRPVSAVVVEVLGYLGAAVALVSGLLISAQLWPELASWSRVSLLVVLTIVAGSAAGALAGRTSGAIGRLSSFLWAVFVVAVATSVGVASYEFTGMTTDDATLTALAVGTVAAGVVYARRRAALQQVVLFVSLLVTVAAGMVRFDESLGGSVGFVIWAIGIAWLLGAWGRYLQPLPVGFALGTLAVVVGPFAITSIDLRLALSLGLVSTVALLVGGIRTRRGAVIGIAVAAVLIYLPRSFGAFFADLFGPMTVAFVLGVLLLAAAVVLARYLPRDGGES